MRPTRICAPAGWGAISTWPGQRTTRSRASRSPTRSTPRSPLRASPSQPSPRSTTTGSGQKACGAIRETRMLDAIGSFTPSSDPGRAQVAEVAAQVAQPPWPAAPLRRRKLGQPGHLSHELRSFPVPPRRSRGHDRRGPAAALRHGQRAGDVRHARRPGDRLRERSRPDRGLTSTLSATSRRAASPTA